MHANLQIILAMVYLLKDKVFVSPNNVETVTVNVKLIMRLMKTHHVRFDDFVTGRLQNSQIFNQFLK